MSKVYLKFIVFIFTLSFVPNVVQANWSIDVESGIAFNGYNNIRIPGKTGTKLSLSEELKSESIEFIRVRIIRDISKRSRLSILYAPLSFNSSGFVNRDINFNDVIFPALEPVSSFYRFNSYRLSYHYKWISNDNFEAGFGFTAKIRDASIRLKSKYNFSEKNNIGFVPLINFDIDWQFSSKLGLIFEGDALAAPQGRAEDVLLAFYYDPLNKFDFRLGYRILEGGADNDEVYTFALIHYISAGITYSI